jgi:hypothetical protein
MTVGTRTLTASGGGTDVYVVSHSATGVFRWATSFGGSGNDLPRGLAASANGDVA